MLWRRQLSLTDPNAPEKDITLRAQKSLRKVMSGARINASDCSSACLSKDFH